MKTTAPLPLSTTTALQGLAFWIGYRREIYPHHDLGEAALVAELCGLLTAHCAPDQRVLCERQYSELARARSKEQFGDTRADIVIASATRRQGKAAIVKPDRGPLTVFEVKRHGASPAAIVADLRRLSALKAMRRASRCFLVVASQGQLPRAYVSPETGTSIGAIHYTLASGERRTARIRRVCKAGASFTSLKAAHYVCLLEV